MVKVIGPLASHWASGQISAPRVYSSSLRNRHDRQAPPVPPPPSHDLEVTGTITPTSAIGYYDEAGTYNGKPYYAHTDNTWFIWYFFMVHYGLHYWLITMTLGSYDVPRWRRQSGSYSPPPGIYQPFSPATGDATVSIP